MLSVFFGFGIVLLTVIQTLSAGQQAGLEGFLLGSTAGMLRADALVIAGSAAVTLLLVLLMRRPLALASFDPVYAISTGQNVARTDLAMMGLVLPQKRDVPVLPRPCAMKPAQIIRRDPTYEAVASLYDGLTKIETVLTPDQINEVDSRIDLRGVVPA